MRKTYKIEQDGFSCMVYSLEELIEEVYFELDKRQPFNVYEYNDFGDYTLVARMMISR